MIGIIVAVCSVAAFAETDARKDPRELAVLKKVYEGQIEKAVAPIRKAYADNLRRLLKDLTTKGDLDGAILVQNELKDLNLDNGERDIVGTWTHLDDRSRWVFNKDGTWSNQFGDTGTYKVSASGRVSIKFINRHQGVVWEFVAKGANFYAVSGGGDNVLWVRRDDAN
jgi:hypothetical protein